MKKLKKLKVKKVKKLKYLSQPHCSEFGVRVSTLTTTTGRGPASSRTQCYLIIGTTWDLFTITKKVIIINVPKLRHSQLFSI